MRFGLKDPRSSWCPARGSAPDQACFCCEQELLQAVVGLSYTGDVRMGFAEDSRKVERIVSGSFPGLCDLYVPRLKVRPWPVRAWCASAGAPGWQGGSPRSPPPAGGNITGEQLSRVGW